MLESPPCCTVCRLRPQAWWQGRAGVRLKPSRHPRRAALARSSRGPGGPLGHRLLPPTEGSCVRVQRGRLALPGSQPQWTSADGSWASQVSVHLRWKPPLACIWVLAGPAPVGQAPRCCQSVGPTSSFSCGRGPWLVFSRPWTPETELRAHASDITSEAHARAGRGHRPRAFAHRVRSVSLRCTLGRSWADLPARLCSTPFVERVSSSSRQGPGPVSLGRRSRVLKVPCGHGAPAPAHQHSEASLPRKSGARSRGGAPQSSTQWPLTVVSGQSCPSARFCPGDGDRVPAALCAKAGSPSVTSKTLAALVVPGLGASPEHSGCAAGTGRAPGLGRCRPAHSSLPSSARAPRLCPAVTDPPLPRSRPGWAPVVQGAVSDECMLLWQAPQQSTPPAVHTGSLLVPLTGAAGSVPAACAVPGAWSGTVASTADQS